MQDKEANSTVFVRLLFAIIVRQCIVLPKDHPIIDEFCKDAGIRKALEVVVTLNEKLVTLSCLNNITYDNPAFIEVFKLYNETLSKLGFTKDQRRELLPAGLPWPTMLSLLDQSVLQYGLEYIKLNDKADQENFVKQLQLPKDILNKITDVDNIKKLIIQTYINMSVNRRPIFLMTHRFEKKLVKDMTKIFREVIDFSPASPEIKPLEIMQMLLEIIFSPTNLANRNNILIGNIFHIAAVYVPTFALKELSLLLPEFDLTLLNSAGMNLLHIAATDGSVTSLSLLVELCKKHPEMLNAKNNQMQLSPLHCAVDTGSLLKVKILVEAGADINQPNSLGETPLHIASRRNSALSSYLLDQGAQTELKNSDQLTPFECYLQSGGAWYEDQQIFEDYYDKKLQQVCLYEEQLNSQDCLDQLITALRESRGLIFFREFLKKFPDILKEYQDADGNNVIQIINQAKVDHPERRFTNKYLLATISKELPELLFIVNSSGLSGIDQTINSYNFGFCCVCVDPNTDHWMEMDLMHHDVFYQNTSPNRRAKGALNCMAAVAFIVALVMSAAIIESDYLKKSLILAGIFLAVLGLFLTWANTPPRFWGQCYGALVDRCGGRLQSFGNSFMLTEVVLDHGLVTITNQQEIDQMEKIELIHPNPAGININLLNRVREKSLSSILESLRNYLKKFILGLENPAQVTLLRNLLNDFDNQSALKDDSSQASSVLGIIQRRILSKEFLPYGDQFNNIIADYCNSIHEFCDQPVVQHDNSATSYGTMRL